MSFLKFDECTFSNQAVTDDTDDQMSGPYKLKGCEILSDGRMRLHGETFYNGRRKLIDNLPSWDGVCDQEHSSGVFELILPAEGSCISSDQSWFNEVADDDSLQWADSSFSHQCIGTSE